MGDDKIKIFLFAGLLFMAWGGYKASTAIYTSISWNETRGTIVDFERNTWSCGKGVSECYSIVVGYHVNQDYFTVTGDKNYRDQPRKLHGKEVIVYYSPDDPHQAILGGEFSPLNISILKFLIGCVLIIIYWFIKKRA